MAALQSHW
ncbi:hypothetical protein LINPERPRIM_LOCUS35183 [Linum perenne]